MLVWYRMNISVCVEYSTKNIRDPTSAATLKTWNQNSIVFFKTRNPTSSKFLFGISTRMQPNKYTKIHLNKEFIKSYVTQICTCFFTVKENNLI